MTTCSPVLTKKSSVRCVSASSKTGPNNIPSSVVSFRLRMGYEELPVTVEIGVLGRSMTTGASYKLS